MRTLNKAVAIYKAEKEKLLKRGYTEKDAQNTSLDDLVLKILTSMAESTGGFGKLSVSDATHILTRLPEKIEVDDDNYVAIAKNYLSYAIPSKRYIKTLPVSDDALIFAQTENKKIAKLEPPITITYSLNPDISYSDKECSFMAAIAPLILNRHFSDVKEIILNEWEIEINDIQFIDKYRAKRIEDILAAAYEQGNGYIHIINPKKRRSIIVDLTKKEGISEVIL